MAMTTQPPINDMSLEERLETLKLLSDALQFSAVIARQQGDEAYKAMDCLAERLRADAQILAHDPSPTTNAVVMEAITLLGNFQMAHPARNNRKH
jgi:hypothetical protein